jgi:hypothetical protein
MRKFVLFLFIIISVNIYGQDSLVVLKGYVMDEESGDTLKFANVSLLQNDTVVKNTASNMNGFFQFTEVKPGIYNLKIDYVGYRIMIIEGLVAGSKILNIYLQRGDHDLFEIIDEVFRIPVYTPDQSPGLRLDSKRIQKAATRSF